MQISFNKYQGTGNDFILLDNREQHYDLISPEQVRFLCDRHFGVGADGLMLLGNAISFDTHFTMKYYNSDGNESTMCGNGGRCITAFARTLGLITDKAMFTAIDGIHEAKIDDEHYVRLLMNDVRSIEVGETFMELNTGSPHYVAFTEEISALDMKREGRLIRYSPRYTAQGINVNFVERLEGNMIFVRTYERGVEDETLSCGTGVTAAAIASQMGRQGAQQVTVKTLGGQLDVFFTMREDGSYTDIWLCGKASFVFTGQIDL